MTSSEAIFLTACFRLTDDFGDIRFPCKFEITSVLNNFGFTVGDLLNYVRFIGADVHTV